MKATVLGSGSWGTALSILLARNGHDVTLWGCEQEDIEIIRSHRENLHYLPGFTIPQNVTAEYDPSALQESDMWVVAIPSRAARSVMHVILGESPIVTIASKGLEPGTADTISRACGQELPHARIATISGPNLAIEIVRKVPTAAVVASASPEVVEIVRSAFMCSAYRVYVSDDTVGVELAGALKNVLAIGAGISDGLGFGDNTKGTLMARGLNEMACLGIAMGGHMETFMGIAGVGDLFATAVSTLSRNYRVGRALGEGHTLQEALDLIGQVAEGVVTSESAVVLGRRFQIPVPIFDTIEAVIRGRVKPHEAVSLLMERQPRSEGFLRS
jgi:glycerol-3-phosphate dehydrogenase (NAD(P)+)